MGPLPGGRGQEREVRRQLSPGRAGGWPGVSWELRLL